MTDVRESISQLEKDYYSHKENFERWKAEHAPSAGDPSYNVQ
jgi:hypothetical protein